MTRVFNDPAAFKEEVLGGFALAYEHYVERVDGASGFVRRGGTREGKVALVVGGGSGHYPSYSGVTGSGFADGAVLGDVFTSPSTEQVYRIARAADGGAGIVMAFGNYAGDRLNFAEAAERLGREGTVCRIVYVTDDIASAPVNEADRRRGIAGTFTVYKIGGASAERGDDLDTVERIMRSANSRTISFGVAFAGCTFPGQSEPLFTVAEGSMDFGLGIHGEPGIRSDAWMPAEKIARSLVEPLLVERPDGAKKAAVLLNGLGATKYEELFLLWGCIQPLLVEAGVELVLPEVGELVTSLDMAGCSLSITWLDDELEELWRAPADTPSYRRGRAEPMVEHVRHRSVGRQVAVDTGQAASPASRRAAVVAREVIDVMTDVAVEHEQELGRIDAIAGDGDHGSGMARGLRAARAAAAEQTGGVRSVLSAAGLAFADKAGGTSGVLWGRFLQTIGDHLGDAEDVTAEALASAVRIAAEDMQTFGKAELGDKTMLDALFPFVDALDVGLAVGQPLFRAWTSAAARAVEAAAETSDLVPKVGRARPLADRSVGTPDAGATSMGLLLTAAGGVLTASCGEYAARRSS